MQTSALPLGYGARGGKVATYHGFFKCLPNEASWLATWRRLDSPAQIQLPAEQPNAYLEEDGLPDVLEARRAGNELGAAARERYSKHVKAVFQVGEARAMLDARRFECGVW